MGYFLYIVSFCAILFATNINAYSKTGKQVMQEVYSQANKYKTEKKTIKLIITNKDSEEKIRYFDSTKKETKERTGTIIRFYKPKNIKGTALLTERVDGKEEPSQWFYFPFLRQVKQLGASDRNNSFMGSDFSYDDVAGRKVNQDKHKITKETKKYFYIKSTPNSKTSAYKYMDLVVSKKHKVILKIDFYNKKDQKIKTLNNKRLKLISGVKTIMRCIMTNHISKGKSEFFIQDISYGIDVSDVDVGLRGLTK